MSVTMESAVFMGKNFQNNQNSIVNTTDLTLKQMFDISAKLVAEEDEISGLETIGWEKHSWKYLSLIGTDDSGIIVYFRALQGHSGRNLIDPSLQDNVVIQSGFFQHMYHIGCAFNLHSIINSGLIPGGQNSSKRQTVFFLPVDPRDNSHKDPEKIDLNVPRRAQYLHRAHGRNIKTRYFGLFLILRFKRD